MNDINETLSNLMKEAQKVQQRMQETQNELTQLVVRGEAGGGLVIVKMNGKHDVLEVKVDPSLLTDIRMLEALFASAVNDAVRKIEKESKDRITKLTAGLSLPTDLMQTEDE